MAKKTSKRRRKSRTWLWVLIGVLAFLLVVVLTVGIFINVTLNKIARTDPETESYMTTEEAEEYDLRQAMEEKGEEGVVYPELDPNDIHWTTPTDTIGTGEDTVNILLIGQDRREGESRQRSDSMILVTFNKSNNTITMTSFLRDLYVQIPGYQDNRLNAAYAFGGMELLDQTLEANFGVQVDANMEVDFTGFSSIIDIMGGVDIELTEAEANIVGVGSGLQHLDGNAALTYARIRKIDSDFGRTNRQRKVLTSVYQNVKDISISQALELVNTVFPMLTTDMSNADIVGYATDLFPMLSSCTLNTCRIPADDTYTFNTVRGMAVIIADFEANREILKETLEPAA